ncbi:MAG: hypothetical protein ACRENQ_14750, partial [Gemmatimonadaceae bacterium]
VSLTANRTTATRTLTVRMDPRVHVAASSLRAQFALAMSVDSTLDRATATHRRVRAYLAAHQGGLSPAETDSATAIAGDLATVDGVLASLAAQVVEADAAPNQGERGVLAEYTRQLQALAARWQAVQTRAGGG